MSTRGLSQKKASAPAMRSQKTATHRTGAQEPVLSTSKAAPQPAKIEAVPFAVYWSP